MDKLLTFVGDRLSDTARACGHCHQERLKLLIRQTQPQALHAHAVGLDVEPSAGGHKDHRATFVLAEEVNNRYA